MTERGDAGAAAPTQAQLLGLDAGHVVPLETGAGSAGVRLHPAARSAFLALREAARTDGFDLRVVSGHRSFERQALIWNGKARGERAVLDAVEAPVDVLALAEARRVDAILLWSALPGCSRHHWGTDMDLVDFAALAPGEPPRLEARDWIGQGVFAPLERWLADRIGRGDAMGLFRPYTGHGCAVAPEPWHLSYAPLAERCEALLDRDALCAALQGGGIELLGAIEARLDDILARYVRLPPMLYPARMDGRERG
jgi:LAS superfamily LD-carboxypeptidase LdcB